MNEMHIGMSDGWDGMGWDWDWDWDGDGDGDGDGMGMGWDGILSQLTVHRRSTFGP